MKRKLPLRNTAVLLLISVLLGVLTGCSSQTPQTEEPTVYNPEVQDYTLNAPASTIEVVNFNSADSGFGDVSARILQGVINKTQPRVYIAKDWTKNGVNCEKVRQEILVKYGGVQLQELTRDDSENHVGYSTFWTLFPQYSSEIERIFVYSSDTELADTINVAAMFASRYHGVAVNQELCDQILAAGYDLPVVNICEYCGFTGENANAFYINQWIGDNMAKGANQSIVFAITPTERDSGEKFLPPMYDMAVATNALIYSAAYVYLDKGKDVQASILSHFPDNTPVIGWPGLNMESDFVTSISKAGKTVAGADWEFSNGSLLAAFPEYKGTGETISPIPDSYEVNNNEVYIAFMVSDGDAWHFNYGDFLSFWENPVRGTLPIGWTIPSLFSIYNPLFLQFYDDTKTSLDNLLQGPSGIGYMYASKSPEKSYDNFLTNTKSIFSKLGINMVNFWDYADGDPSMAGSDLSLVQQYADVVKPDAIFRGHSSVNCDYSVYNGTVIINEIGNLDGRGAMNASDIVTAIDTVKNQTESGKPVFVLVNLEAWGECVTTLQSAVDTINSRSDASIYHFVTPAQLVAGIRTYKNVD